MRGFEYLSAQLEEHRPARRFRPTRRIDEVQRFKPPVIVSNLNVEEPRGTPPVIVSDFHVEDYRAAPSVIVFRRGLVEDLPVAEQPGGRGLPELLPTRQAPGSEEITVHPRDNDGFGQKVLREQPLNGFQAGTQVPHGLARAPWTVHNLAFRDRPVLLGGVTGDRPGPTDQIRLAASMGDARARLGVPSVMVTGPNVERLVACSLPGQRRLWAWVESSEGSRPLVAYAVGLLSEPAETLCRTPLGLLWSVDHGDLGALGGPLGLSEQVAGLTGTIGEALSSTFAGGLELMGVNPVGALIGGEICGALGKAMVAPLVAHLVVAAQLIEIWSLILPHGDPRALVSLEAAKGWTEKAVVQGLSDRVEPFSDEVAAGAALLLSVLATGRERSSLRIRPRVEVGSGIELSGNPRGLDRRSSMAASTSKKRASQMERDMLDYDQVERNTFDYDRIDQPGLRGKITMVGEPRHRIEPDAFTYDRVDPLVGGRDALPKITTPLGALPRLVTQGPRGDGLAGRLDTFRRPS